MKGGGDGRSSEGDLYVFSRNVARKREFTRTRYLPMAPSRNAPPLLNKPTTGSSELINRTPIFFRDVGIQVSNLIEVSGIGALHSINKHPYHMTSEFM